MSGVLIYGLSVLLLTGLLRALVGIVTALDNRRAAATSNRIADAIEAEAKAEAIRLEWDGAPGMVGNWIGGFTEAARIARADTQTTDGDEG